MMTRRRLTAFATMLALLALCGESQAATDGSWDGTWAGMLNKDTPVSVVIKNRKVVKYANEGVAFNVQYSKVTSSIVSFGDKDNYAVKITKTGETTASEIVHGRNGYRSAILTKQ